MNLEELNREIAGGGLRPAYLLAGDEPLLRDDALASLRSAVLEEGQADFNFDRFEGTAATGGQLIDTVRTLPVFASRRLVVVIEPDARRASSKGLCEALASLLAEDGALASTVLVAVATKPDKRSRWVKAFGDALVDCTAPRRAREVAAFVRTEAGRQEVSIERGVAEALAERIGPQLLLLRQEIAKLGLLAGLGNPVTRAHVAAGTTLSSDEPIWDLTDAIGEGRSADALGVLARLLRAGSPPQVLLGALVSHFRRLLRTASGGDVPGPPFVRRKLASQAHRYGAGRLRGALAAIHETDLALKGAGSLRPELALERLVIALAA